MAILAFAVWPVAGEAAGPPKPETGKPAPAKGIGLQMLPGAGSKQPISIDADKLDYFDKEQKLVYTGNVVAVQGDSTLKGSVLTIFLIKGAGGPGQASGAAPAPNAPPGGDPPPGAAPPTGGAGGGIGAGSSVKHMEVEGPVTVTSKDQVGTGDHGSYDKGEDKIYLTGHVTLSQGVNITQGDKLVYDLTSGQAQIFSGSTNGRVKSVFTPGSGTPDTGKGKTEKPSPKPKVQAKPPRTTAAEQ